MESRFPVSHSAGHARVEFAWFDAFRPQVCCCSGGHGCSFGSDGQGRAACRLAGAGQLALAHPACHPLLASTRAPQKRAEQASLHFEKAAIAFNLGAVQVRLAGVPRHQTHRAHECSCRSQPALWCSFARFAPHANATWDLSSPFLAHRASWRWRATARQMRG